MSTTPIHGIKTRIYADEFDLGQYLTDAESPSETEVLEKTCFNDTDRTFQRGLDMGSLQVDGFYEQTVEGNMNTLKGRANPILTVSPNGGLSLVGSRANLLHSIFTQINPQPSITGLIRFSAGFQGHGGIRHGQLLTTGKETVTVTGQGASIDGAAQTTNGFVAHAHVIAFNGTSIDVAIEDSVNDSTWANLYSFAQFTAVGAQRHVSAITATVERYVRVAFTVVGTTFDVVVAFYRTP